MKKNYILIVLLAISINVHGQLSNAYYDSITGSVSNFNISTLNDYTLSQFEYQKYVIPEMGAVKAYCLAKTDLKDGTQSVLLLCLKIENGYSQLLINIDKYGTLIDALEVAYDKILFINKMDDGSYQYSTEKNSIIEGDIIKVITKKKVGGAPWDDSPVYYTENDATYIIDAKGEFKIVP